MKMKVGFGYDVHKLQEGKKLILGGVEVENSPLGVVGHSDADVLIHAIIDSLLGAANLRDIGFQYPDSDDKYKGIDSKLLLKDTLFKIKAKGYKIENIDSTISLQSPKISSYIPKMKEVLAQLLDVDLENVSVKATTTEHLGFEGRKEGVSAYSVCLLSKD
ncbi:MAG: 2-C-methyl-D-erythritol 2,4-cyclodiphosphate synthase [Bacteroidales bacterium]|nr:2-C-methyl-D-erythritol 2,4-cyclodiphosphate synthase [Bacteroidales bacterium]